MVQEGQPLATGQRGGRVGGAGDPAWPLEQLDAKPGRIALQPLPEQPLDPRIFRGVVGDAQLPLRVDLLLDGVERRPQQFRIHAVHRNDHRDRRTVFERPAVVRPPLPLVGAGSGEKPPRPILAVAQSRRHAGDGAPGQRCRQDQHAPDAIRPRALEGPHLVAAQTQQDLLVLQQALQRGDPNVTVGEVSAVATQPGLELEDVLRQSCEQAVERAVQRSSRARRSAAAGILTSPQEGSGLTFQHSRPELMERPRTRMFKC